MKQQLCLTAVLLGCLAGPAAAGGWPHVSRAPRRCVLPGYAYQPVRVSAPVAAPTFTAVLVERLLVPPAVVAAPAVGGVAPAFAIEPVREIRFFQLAEPRLIVSHCAISRVAVTLWEDGRWVINLRAEQTPVDTPPDIAESTARFKRNKFFVTARGYGNYLLRENIADSVLGKPELLRIEVPGFWLERLETREVRLEGRFPPTPIDWSPDLPPGLEASDIFGRVNRMEIEFRIE